MSETTGVREKAAPVSDCPEPSAGTGGESLTRAPTISIVIPLHVYGERFLSDFHHYLELDYPKYEIVLVSDVDVDLRHERVKHVRTVKQRTGPAEKRDAALGRCAGAICAFIDDDAYPDRDWLKNAVRHFDDEQAVAAVGGPGVTPESDGLMERAGGAVYASVLGSGGNVYRFTPEAPREVDDYPAYNLLVRKSALVEVGGFGSTFYGGEDTKLCLRLVHAGKKIIYDPRVVVYHHRRPLFAAHLWQVANVGVHRGYFVKAYPASSRRLLYFLPSLGTVAIGLSLLVSFVSPMVMKYLVLALAGWLCACCLSVWRSEKDPRIIVLAGLGIVATHLTYGLAFLRGLSLRKLDR